MNDGGLSLEMIRQQRIGEVPDHVRRLVIDILCVEDAWPTDAAVLTDAPGADSLDIVELQVALEDAYAVELPDEELAEVRTVGELIAVVQTKL